MKPIHTQFFKVICFLSLLNASYGIISGVLGAIAPPDVDQAFIDGFMERLDQFELPMEGLRDDVKTYYLNLMLTMGNVAAANFLFFGIEMIGVILMFRLNRIGFVLYIASQIGLAFIPAVFGGFSQFGIAVLVFTLLWNLVWIIMYQTQVKKFPKE
ncbi:hypothetical protein O3Q51_01820 [Cryomorphaceae bacterium 1068]|nr:hypothetical protein [Cryomorphaceae bacterium 1068]